MLYAILTCEICFILCLSTARDKLVPRFCRYFHHGFLTVMLYSFRDLWKEWGDSNFHIFSQNYQFHPRRLEQGDLHTTGDDSDLIYVHTRVRVGPTSHKSYSITNWCE